MRQLIFFSPRARFAVKAGPPFVIESPCHFPSITFILKIFSTNQGLLVVDVTLMLHLNKDTQGVSIVGGPGFEGKSGARGEKDQLPHKPIYNEPQIGNNLL